MMPFSHQKILYILDTIFQKEYKNITIGDIIIDEKPQYDINIEAAKIPALSSHNFDKSGCVTGEEILPSDQSRMIEQVNLLIPLLEKFSKNKLKQWTIKVKIK